MDEEIEQLVVRVRADTGGFARDISTMRGNLEAGLGDGATRAGRSVEAALAKAARTGSLGFEDLRRTALAVLGDIGRAAIGKGVASAGLGGGPGTGPGGGLGQVASALLTGLLGLPGRATGGPVSPGAAYVVGERGPELFVPTASGRVAPAAGLPPAKRERAGGGDGGRASRAGPRPRAAAPVPAASALPPRDVRVSIRIAADGGDEARALARSGRQVARAVRAALDAAEG